MGNTFTTLTDTIISQVAIEAFTATLAPLTAFSVNASPSPVQKGDKVKVLQVPAQDAATDFSSSYSMADADATGIDVSINKHKFVSWAITDVDLSTQPQLAVEIFGRQKGFQLAKAVLQDIWSAITLANFGAAAFVGASSTFDADDVVDIGKACDDDNWSEISRSLILSNAYHAALRKDNVLQQAFAFGSSDVVRRGMIPSLDTFSNIYKSNLIPSNSEALVGFAVLPDALLVAMRYLQPQSGNMYNAAEAVTDTETGFTIGYRQWYDRDAGEMRSVLECNYGYVKGNATAIKRMTSA